MPQMKNHSATDNGWPAAHLETKVKLTASLLTENASEPGEYYTVRDGRKNPRRCFPSSPLTAVQMPKDNHKEQWVVGMSL